MSRSAALLFAALTLPGCAGRPGAPRPPLFPLTPAWKTMLSDFVVPPLAADGRRVFVATRDGAVTALDQATGAVVWRAEGRPGRLTGADGIVLVRSEEGAVSRLQPRGGAERWTTDTSVPGTLPAVIDRDRVFVAGQGLAALDLATGRLLWTDRAGTETTAPPVGTGARLVSGEADGTLRCRDRATGLSLWTLRTGSRLLAPPLVDEARRRLYVGTTDKRIVEVDLAKGREGWSWRVGADVANPGLLRPDLVLFVSFDAVLYALRRGGNLGWRSGLPSRPLSGPLMVEGYLLVACHENELVGFTPEAGSPAGTLRTAAEIRTPPLLAGPRIVLGLRDRSVVAYDLPGAREAPPEPEAAPAVEPPPAKPAPPAPPAPPSVERPSPGR